MKIITFLAICILVGAALSINLKNNKREEEQADCPAGKVKKADGTCGKRREEEEADCPAGKVKKADGTCGKKREEEQADCPAGKVKKADGTCA